MFLHSGASLHGHEYHTPPNQPRKKHFLRSSLPPPILRTSSSATVPDRHTPSSPPTRPPHTRRPVSEAYIRPIAHLLDASGSPPHTLVPANPVVRFKDVPVVDYPATSPPMTTEEEPSVYDSDASQASASTPRRRRRRGAAPRTSTKYLVAASPRHSGSKKSLFKTIRPRLVLQLQELAANHRSKPTIDVFSSSLMTGPLATASSIHRFPRIPGAKAEPGPRDLILVKSEDYTADTEDRDETASARRQPLAVLSPGRGQADDGEILLDDGSVWVCTSSKAHYSFMHVDNHGTSMTVRWVKRNPPKRVSSTPISPGGMRAHSPHFPGMVADMTECDRYTFSIINPMTRRHPVLASLTPQSIEIYDEYTTLSASSSCRPPVSGALDATSSSSKESTQRQTQAVDEDTKKLIMITGIWLSLRLGPSVDGSDGCGDVGIMAQDTPKLTPASTFHNTFPTLPRRQTASCGSSTPPIPAQQTRIKRAMSTGAAFMQRRRRLDTSQAPSSTSAMFEPERMSAASDGRDQVLTTPVILSPASKQVRRTSWFKKLMH